MQDKGERSKQTHAVGGTILESEAKYSTFVHLKLIWKGYF